jgi:hypothetical protein
MMQSPVYVKFQTLGGDMQQVLTEKLVEETRGVIEPKVRALEESIARRLGVTAGWWWRRWRQQPGTRGGGQAACQEVARRSAARGAARPASGRLREPDLAVEAVAGRLEAADLVQRFLQAHLARIHQLAARCSVSGFSRASSAFVSSYRRSLCAP